MKQPSVKRMLRQMSWPELLDWVAFYELEPWGWEYEEIKDRRDSIRAASIACMIANVNRNSKKRPHPYKVEDFVIDFSSTPKRKKTTEEIKQTIFAIVRAYSSAKKKKGPN